MMNFIVTAFVAATTLSYPSPVNVFTADLHEPTAIIAEPLLRPAERALKVQEVRDMLVTAYSSTPEQTDDTPFVTASGTAVRDGIVATNMLPMGTKIRIPAYFGNKIFIVEDRMHERMVNRVDIWMATTTDALRFGIRPAQIQVLK